MTCSYQMTVRLRSERRSSRTERGKQTVVIRLSPHTAATGHKAHPDFHRLQRESDR